MELLGYADPVEALEATIHVLRNGEPEHDPVTGKNAWTDAFTLLAHREKAREAEAERATEEGTADDPRSPLLRSALAAYRAVHEPIGGGECAMDRCRREARRTLGVAEPSRKTSVAGLARDATISPSGEAEDAEVRQKATEALGPYCGEISRCAREFLHAVTENSRDHMKAVLPEVTPMPEEPEPEAEHAPILEAEELVKQFKGATP